jgi:hypothetical protein
LRNRFVIYRYIGVINFNKPKEGIGYFDNIWKLLDLPICGKKEKWQEGNSIISKSCQLPTDYHLKNHPQLIHCFMMVLKGHLRHVVFASCGKIYPNLLPHCSSCVFYRIPYVVKEESNQLLYFEDRNYDLYHYYLLSWNNSFRLRAGWLFIDLRYKGRFSIISSYF